MKKEIIIIDQVKVFLLTVFFPRNPQVIEFIESSLSDVHSILLYFIIGMFSLSTGLADRFEEYPKLRELIRLKVTAKSNIYLTFSCHLGVKSPGNVQVASSC